LKIVVNRSPYAVNGYLVEIPRAWADAHAGGRYLGTGRYKDGGWSGMGPALFALAPWAEGNPPADGTRLPATTLLLYSNTRGEDPTEFRLRGYQHCDEWEGGAWLTSGDRAALIFGGTKGVGSVYWYGWRHPSGDDRPCIDADVSPETGGYCFAADGTPCPPELRVPCSNDAGDRGWWTSAWEAQFLFYDPADLAAVADGASEPHEPQPYASLALDERLFLDAAAPDIVATVGAGAQRRYRLGEMTYDRERGLLYVLERFADGSRPVVHVWRIE
jgi:hypothetical protein